MKDLAIIGALTLVFCSLMDIGRHNGSSIDPERARLLEPGVTSLDEAVEIVGAEPIYPLEWWRGAVTVVWYSAWGDLMEPDTLQVEYKLEARFDDHERLIDLTLVDHRSHPNERWDSILALRPDVDLAARRRIRVSPALG